MIELVKEENRRHQEQMNDLYAQVFAAYFNRIKLFLQRELGMYRGYTAQVHTVTESQVTVMCRVHRHDPLFDDFDDYQDIPWDFLTCKDPDAWFTIREVEEKLAREKAVLKAKEEKLSKLKLQVSELNKEIEALS